MNTTKKNLPHKLIRDFIENYNNPESEIEIITDQSYILDQIKPLNFYVSYVGKSNDFFAYILKLINAEYIYFISRYHGLLSYKIPKKLGTNFLNLTLSDNTIDKFDYILSSDFKQQISFNFDNGIISTNFSFETSNLTVSNKNDEYEKLLSLKKQFENILASNTLSVSFIKLTHQKLLNINNKLKNFNN